MIAAPDGGTKTQRPPQTEGSLQMLHAYSATCQSKKGIKRQMSGSMREVTLASLRLQRLDHSHGLAPRTVTYQKAS